MKIEQDLTIDASWSRLLDTEMGELVTHYMDDPRRKYHNINHVRRLYELANTLKIPYYAKLDAAILWHDVVYDEHPDKEVRSAELLKETAQEYPEWFRDFSVTQTNEMILNTITHRYIPQIDPWLIRLDTYDLSIDPQRYKNFWLLIDEAMELYDISICDAAKGTKDFMRPFFYIMRDNARKDYTFDRWDDIADGCDSVIYLADTVLETHKRSK